MESNCISLLHRLTDAHCHPNDAFDGRDMDRSAHQIGLLTIGQVCVMSSSLQSQSRTEELFHLQPKKVIPAFGLHPWYTATISTDGNLDKLSHYSKVLSGKINRKNAHNHPPSHRLVPESSEKDAEEVLYEWIHSHLEQLPTPIKLDDLLSDLRSRLCKYSNSIVGEIGLDKAFRFHLNLSSSFSSSKDEQEKDNSHESDLLKTNFKISIDHQLIILRSQIELAIELSRPISLHCVQAPIELLDLFQELKDKWGARFTGNPAAINSSSSRKKKLNKIGPSFGKDEIKKLDSLLNHPDPHQPDDKKYTLGQEKKKDLDSQGGPTQDQNSLLSSNRFKICWHSPSISTEILQRTLKLLPNIIYFSYSNDLALLFKPKRRSDTQEDTGKRKIMDPDWEKIYSQRISNSIRSTPVDRLLIESDHGSDPVLMDEKLVKILILIHFLQHRDDTTGPLNDHSLDTMNRVVTQIESNWNQFYSFLPPPS